MPTLYSYVNKRGLAMKNVVNNGKRSKNQHPPKSNSKLNSIRNYIIKSLSNFGTKFIKPFSKAYHALLLKLNFHNKKSQTKKNYDENTTSETIKRATDKPESPLSRDNGKAIAFLNEVQNQVADSDNSAYIQTNDQSDKRLEEYKVSEVKGFINESGVPKPIAEKSTTILSNDVPNGITDANSESDKPEIKIEINKDEKTDNLTDSTDHITPTLTPGFNKESIKINRPDPAEQKKLKKDTAKIPTAAQQTKPKSENLQTNNTPAKRVSINTDKVETDHSGVDLKDDILDAITPAAQKDFISYMSKLKTPEQERLKRDALEILTIMKQADINNGEEKENSPDTLLHQLCKDGSIEEIKKNYSGLLRYAGHKNLKGQIPRDILKNRFSEIPLELMGCYEDISQFLYSFDTPFHELCKHGSIDEINENYPALLKYAGYKNLQGQLPYDILKRRFYKWSIVPHKLKKCDNALNKEMTLRYSNMKNNFVSFFEEDGCTEKFSKFFEDPGGFCFGLVYMRGQYFLDTSKDNTSLITQFDFIMSLLCRDFSRFPLSVKNNTGEEVICNSLFKVVNTINDESRLPLRQFLTELLSTHKPKMTTLSEISKQAEEIEESKYLKEAEPFPEIKIESQNISKSSEVQAKKIEIFADTCFLGDKFDFREVLDDLFNELKKMPENFFLYLDNGRHVISINYDPKSNKLLVFNQNHLQNKNKQLAEPFSDTKTLVNAVFDKLKRKDEEYKEDEEAVIFLNMKVYTRPQTLRNQKDMQHILQESFNEKHRYLTKIHYKKEKDRIAIQKIIKTLLYKQNDVKPDAQNSISLNLIRENNNQDTRRLVLYYAIKQEHKDLVRLLANEKALLDIQNKHGETVLFDAVATGNPEIVEILLAAGADKNIKDYSGRTLLFEAIRAGQVQMVKMLIEKGLDVNATSEDGKTPLFYAVVDENLEAVDLLIKAHANIDLVDKRGDKPIDIARMLQLNTIEQKLIKKSMIRSPGR